MAQIVFIVAVVIIVVLDAAVALAGYRLMKEVCMKVVESIQEKDSSCEP